ncbi:MAG: hypothetical protein DLM59_04380 [Pseudonocardiales bacterium]|nr:MAG: hypothetical protein DLM59_04380 [Pseudonocardiales bacterium]
MLGVARLRLLVAVADAGSLTAVAAALTFSQPAADRIVLERHPD